MMDKVTSGISSKSVGLDQMVEETRELSKVFRNVMRVLIT